ncbi:ead/Ea22-like family protein [Klebsiella pneumoniae]|uniref:ead/Ea22-like family protein n=1 Tax=Klebsiella pneumoniae TaxID=573 RepID=UPI0010D8AA1F|nr:ead/Ea22-like family protein [Klebsiella pneumoniae]VGC40406.1 Ead domain protein [Klebsiella pneumoniae]
MTDITELAQSLKAAAEKATQGNWRAFQYHDGRCGIGGGHNDEIMVCEHISKERPHDAMFIAMANPANVLALVEALEKAQAQSSKWLEAYHKAVSIGARYEERIAELESRTVKLPKLKMLEDYLAEVAIEERKQILVGVKLEFHRALAAAGIKVEAE